MGFYVDDKDHFEVKKNDLAVSKNDYSYSPSSNSIVFNTTPKNGDIIEVTRKTILERGITYATYNNTFRPEILNNDLDRIWLKLQELGVADWLLKFYVDDLHQEQKSYIDQKNNELKNYLIEEIKKQGVALDQLEEYYNYLIQRLAEVAVSGGWEASLIADRNGKTQQQLNDEQQIINNTLKYDSGITTWSGRTQDDKNTDYKHIKDFGAVCNGIKDDSDAFIRAFQSGASIKFGDKHLISKTISVPLATKDSISYDFTDTKILVDESLAAPLGNAIYLQVENVGNLLIKGFNLDAKNKAANGLNIIQSTAKTTCNVTITDCVIKNIRRAKSHLSHTGHANLGNGLFIRGGFDRISLSNITIDNVTLEKGSEVEGTVGIAGITISRINSDGTTYSYNKLDITNIHINKIFCDDDINHFIDQDGIRILSYAPTDTATWQGGIFAPISKTDIQNCLFYNCRGRAIKTQAMMTDINNVTIVRSGAEAVSTGSGMGDIDFQHGGGKVSDIRFYYTNKGCSYNMLVCTGNRYDAQLYNDFFSITDVSIVTHSASPRNFIFASTQFSLAYMLKVTGVQHFSQQTTGHLTNFISYSCKDNTTGYNRNFTLLVDDCSITLNGTGYFFNDAPNAAMLTTNAYKNVARSIILSNTHLRNPSKLQYLADPNNYEKFVTTNNLSLNNVIGYEKDSLITRIAGQNANYTGTVQSVIISERLSTAAGILMDNLSLVADTTVLSRPFLIGSTSSSTVVVELILKISGISSQYYKFILSCYDGTITLLETPNEVDRFLVFENNINTSINPKAHTTCIYDLTKNCLSLKSTKAYNISLHARF